MSAHISYNDVEFHITDTMMLMLKYNGESNVDIEHDKRTETLKPGEHVGIDLKKRKQKESKKEPPALPDGQVIVRRIGEEAFEECKWGPIEDNDDHAHMIPALVEEATRKVEAGDNDSYKLMWSCAVDAYESGVATFFFARQFCAVKIVPVRTTMDLECRRTGFHSLLVESDGSATKRKAFDSTGEERALVLEPVSKKPKLFMTDGKYDKKSGKYPASAVYNKPITDFAAHWTPVSKDEAMVILETHGRAVPWEQVGFMKARRDEWEKKARVDEFVNSPEERALRDLADKM